MKKIYAKRISFMNNTELLSEYESVKDICQYVGSDSFEFIKKMIIERGLIDRNLGSVIDKMPGFSRLQTNFK